MGEESEQMAGRLKDDANGGRTRSGGTESGRAEHLSLWAQLKTASVHRAGAGEGPHAGAGTRADKGRERVVDLARARCQWR